MEALQRTGRLLCCLRRAAWQGVSRPCRYCWYYPGNAEISPDKEQAREACALGAQLRIMKSTRERARTSNQSSKVDSQLVTFRHVSDYPFPNRTCGFHRIRLSRAMALLAGLVHNTTEPARTAIVPCAPSLIYSGTMGAPSP